jgi:hypothetical protein
MYDKMLGSLSECATLAAFKGTGTESGEHTPPQFFTLTVIWLSLPNFEFLSPFDDVFYFKTIHSHSWDKVTQAAWRKYPNPMNPSVVAIDVLDRKVEDGVLHTHRIISSRWGLPSWVQSIIGSPHVMYANEKSEVDTKERTMTLKTRNITFCKYIAVDEILKYQPHPQDPHKTLLQQEAMVLVEGVPLSSYLEGLLTSTISTNASKVRVSHFFVFLLVMYNLN